MRLAPVFAALVMAFLAVACEDGESTSSQPVRIPTPAGAVIRQNCETIAATDYFLNNEEQTWFRQNCNRLECATIRGTPYVSNIERTWYLANCT